MSSRAPRPTPAESHPELEPVKGFAERGSSLVSRKEAHRFGQDVSQRLTLCDWRIHDIEEGRRLHLDRTRRTEEEIRRTVDQLRRRVELAERSWWQRLKDRMRRTDDRTPIQQLEETVARRQGSPLHRLSSWMRGRLAR